MCLHVCVCRHQQCVSGLQFLSLCPGCRGTSFKSLPSTSSVSCLSRYHPYHRLFMLSVNRIIEENVFIQMCFQILPTAQRLLDELLSSQSTAINTVCGAPGSVSDCNNKEKLNKLRLHSCEPLVIHSTFYLK